ncbi:hypothetical protein V6Z11_A06G058800 [Gossypium hirsutum]
MFFLKLLIFLAGSRFSCSYTDAEPQQDIYAKGDEYHKFR